MKKKIKIIIFFYALFFFICMPEFVSAVDDNYLYYINNKTEQTLDVSNLQKYYYWLVCTYQNSTRNYHFQYLISDKPFIYNSNKNSFKLEDGSLYSDGVGAYYESYTTLQNTLNNISLTRTASNTSYSLNNSVITGGGSISLSSVVYSNNFDIKNQNDVILYPTTIIPPVVYPEILNNIEDLELLNFEYIQVQANDLSFDRFYLDVFDLNGFTDEEINLYLIAMGRKNRILLTPDSQYYNTDLSTDESSIYWIPKSDLGLTWKNKGKYLFQFISSTLVGEGADELEYLSNIGEPVYFTLADGVALSQIEQANQEKQIEQSKNIFQKIGDILSFINPFSENFFVYKLLDLLYEGLKALFIPSNEFFTDWFTDLNDNFAEQFGILYYPVSIIVEFLGNLNVNLVEHEPIINTPDLQLHLFGNDYTIIGATSYNFNNLLDTPEFATAHRWYLFFVNVMFTIGVVAYAGKIAAEIFGGIDDSANSYFDVDNENGAYGDLAVGRDYNRRLTSYDRNQKVRKFRNSSYVSRGRPNRTPHVSYNNSFRR